MRRWRSVKLLSCPCLPAYLPARPPAHLPAHPLLHLLTFPTTSQDSAVALSPEGRFLIVNGGQDPGKVGRRGGVCARRGGRGGASQPHAGRIT